MKKIWTKIKYFFNSFFYGMAAADKAIMSSNSDSENIVINKEVKDERISKALLRGELTQEVQELRYRTYKVDRESKGFEYFSPTLAKRKDISDTKFIKYENEDNLELVTIQPNNFNVGTVNDALKDIDTNKVELYNSNIENELEVSVNVGQFKQPKSYNIKIIRDEYAIPRYYLEEYTTRLVVKKFSPKTKFMLDFYVSKYPNIMDLKSKGFIKEIERIKDEGWKSDIIEFSGVQFITSHAYQMDDMIEFKFKYPQFQKIVEYDGHYIIRFKATIAKQHDMLNDFYSKTMDEKYQKKQAKEVINNINGGQEYKVYICENCGKEITYDTDEINYKPITQARDIDEEFNENSDQISEYFDIQIAEQTTGQKLCRKCFSEWLKNNKIEKSNIYAE